MCEQGSSLELFPVVSRVPGPALDSHPDPAVLVRNVPDTMVFPDSHFSLKWVV